MLTPTRHISALGPGFRRGTRPAAPHPNADALQVDDVFDPFMAEESGRFFAANPAGAEHRDALARETAGIGAPPVGEVAEAFRSGIDRAGEAAIADLEGIARVDQHGVRIVDEGIPVGGIDIGRGLARGVEPRHLHRHNLFLEPHLHPLERHLGGGRIFDVERSTVGERADMVDDGGDPGFAAGDRAVDPFASEEQRSLDAVPGADVEKRLAQHGGIGERGEAIEGGNGEGHGGCPLTRLP